MTNQFQSFEFREMKVQRSHPRLQIQLSVEHKINI
jgi:hypothetical protein